MTDVRLGSVRGDVRVREPRRGVSLTGSLFMYFIYDALVCTIKRVIASQRAVLSSEESLRCFFDFLVTTSAMSCHERSSSSLDSRPRVV